MRIAELWRYSVASMSGEQVTNCKVESSGLKGDRQFLLVCWATGEVASPEGSVHWRSAPLVRARGTGLDLFIKTPRSDWLPAFGVLAQAALDDHFGFAVALKATGAHQPAGHLATKAPRSRYPRAPIHIVTQQMLDVFRALVPTERSGAERFRANIVLDLDEPAEAEAFRPGEELTLGEVRIRLTAPARRCAFVALEQANVARSPEALRAIKNHYGLAFGLYAEVSKPGRLIAAEGERSTASSA